MSPGMYMEKIKRLFEEYSGISDYSVEALPVSGSDRRYFRIRYGGSSLIATEGDSTAENNAFILLTRHFRSKGLPVPEILCVSEDCTCYLQEDLGNASLFDAVAEGRQSGSYRDTETALLRQAVAILPDFQYKGAEGLDFSVCYPVKEFDRMSVMFDLNYFKYCYLKVAGPDFDEVRLEEDFGKLCDRLLVKPCSTFMYRDFQGRNIILKDGSLSFIDYQGGRKGPAIYDLVSFVWQAKARYGRELRDSLVDTYLESASRYTDIDRDAFMEDLRQFALFRTLQVLGAYGFRGLVQRKGHFLESIPYALGNLQELLERPFTEYPYLNGLLQRMAETAPTEDRHDGLIVRIYSFSYKKGIPADTSGNGGGYVFDCRGVPNPGRLPEYRGLTGMDEPVVTYLEQYGEVRDFAALTASLARMHVENYISRGFNDLMFCFGCTGGRHRSVYFAERLAETLASEYGITVRLIHREQNIERTLCMDNGQR